jgi:hypothetical protein
MKGIIAMPDTVPDNPPDAGSVEDRDGKGSRDST